MAFKTLLFSLTLVASFSAQSAVKNLCDDLIASGKSNDEQIKKCLMKFGESDTYKENQKKKKWQEDTNSAKDAEAAAKKANIEQKIFTEADLLDAGFGKPFIVGPVKGSEDNLKIKVITTGDALCNYLGYERVLVSEYSGYVKPQDAHEKGLVVTTNFFGYKSKEPELYKDEDQKYFVKRYKKIICGKAISSEIKGTFDKTDENIFDNNFKVEGVTSPPAKKEDTAQNDGPREDKTKMGYKKPAWATETPSESTNTTDK